MSLQILLIMENTVSSGQWRLGLCRHKWTRSHHYWSSVSSSYGAQSHFKDAVPGWNEKKWCGCTGSTGHFTVGCLQVPLTVSPSCLWILAFVVLPTSGDHEHPEIKQPWEFVTNAVTFFW